MGFQAEPLGDQSSQFAGTGLDVKDSMAETAAEMVMVPLARQLVTRGFIGQQHGYHGSLFHQAFEIAVYGGNAQAGRLLARLLQQLFKFVDDL